MQTFILILIIDLYLSFICFDILGNLKGLDQALNAILSDCEERIYSKSAGVKMEKLGLFVIRGDNIAIMG